MLKFIDEVVVQLRVWRNRPVEPQQMFIIFCHGRSGSELLRTLLNSHPDIYCDAEIYLHRKALLPWRYLVNRSKIYGKAYYGHKAKLGQLENQCPDNNKIREVYLSRVKIIYLRRRNFLRQAISAQIGLQRKIWHDTQINPLAGQKFIINTTNLINGIKNIEKYRKKEKEILTGLDYLSVFYEEDLLHQENHQKTMNRIFDYLGVNTVSVMTPYVKTIPENLENIIGNYLEVIEAVKNSEYAHFLNDIERLG